MGPIESVSAVYGYFQHIVASSDHNSHRLKNCRAGQRGERCEGEINDKLRSNSSGGLADSEMLEDRCRDTGQLDFTSVIVLLTGIILAR